MPDYIFNEVSQYEQVSPSSLEPYQWNSSIYGDTEDVSDLIANISQSGWIKPLVVTPTGIIISGHRRWKAALELKLESVPVEVREFPDETAQLEALLLENATRVKTTEQKVREAQAWSKVEASRAKLRMIATQDNHAGRAAMENFPQLVTAKGTTRDAIASRVGLGSGRTYSKASKVVEAIDSQTVLGNLETAQTLRTVLNARSVDAAHQLLKRIFLSDNTLKASLDKGSSIAGNLGDSTDADPQRSCWNCQYRGEFIANHSFYCNRLGGLSLIEKSAARRGSECDLWNCQQTETDGTNKTQSTQLNFALKLPAHLQPLLQDAARTTGMSVVDWVSEVLESAALATSLAERRFLQPKEKSPARPKK